RFQLSLVPGIAVACNLWLWLCCATVILLGSRDSPPTGKTFEMSKNECDSTPPVAPVNQKHEIRFPSESAAYKPSTGQCPALVQQVTKVQLPGLQDHVFTPADFVQIAEKPAFMRFLPSHNFAGGGVYFEYFSGSGCVESSASQ
ncbi:MAG TPA: hypothetical protein VJN64_17970, partial [Terriglobales bacterium]|nr:hypothetical protein [Terriglobales bacterium]